MGEGKNSFNCANCSMPQESRHEVPGMLKSCPWGPGIKTWSGQQIKKFKKLLKELDKGSLNLILKGWVVLSLEKFNPPEDYISLRKLHVSLSCSQHLDIGPRRPLG